MSYRMKGCIRGWTSASRIKGEIDIIYTDKDKRINVVQVTFSSLYSFTLSHYQK